MTASVWACRRRAVAGFIDPGNEDVLDVIHADDVVEAFARHRQTAVTGVGKSMDQLIEGDGRRDCHDVAARDADVAGGAVAKLQQVAQHLPLERRKVARHGVRGLGFVNRFLDLIAQAGFAVVSENQRAHSAPQPRTAVVVLGRHQPGNQ